MMIYREIFGKSYAEKLELKSDGKSVLLCNYRLELTHAEYALLELLLKYNDWKHKDEIANKLGCGMASIPVHVSNVNKKARALSGRALIEGNRCGEYRIANDI